MNNLKKIAHMIFIIFTILSLLVYTSIAYLNNDFTGIPNYYKFTLLILFLFIFTEYIYTKKLKFLPVNIFYIGAIFFFFANSLGELNNFYERFSWWDNVLHLFSGILINFAMISLIDYFVTKIFILSDINITKYVCFLVIVSTLCSMALGVLWEFYEYSADHLTGSNMQDGLILSSSTAYEEIAPYVNSDNNRVMDKALDDTMNDMFLSTLGAVSAAIIVAFYALRRKLLIFPLTNKIRKLKSVRVKY